GAGGTGGARVGLGAPAVAAAGIAYAYGPGIDPAWELSRSMAVSDRMVLLVRALGVFAVDAALGLAASAASGTAVGITFGWLVPMTAACALALAPATVARSADDGLAPPGGGGRAAHPPYQHFPLVPPLPAVRGRLLLYRAARPPRPERTLRSVEIAGLTRRFGRTQAVAGVDLSAGPGVFGLLG